MVIEKMPNDENIMSPEELEVRFMGFVSLVVNMTMQQLGKIANPITNKVERNLDIAKAWIDMLRMFREKTKGNLNDSEKRFLETNIAGLEMNYVDELKSKPESKTETEKPGNEEKQTGDEPPESPKKE